MCGSQDEILRVPHKQTGEMDLPTMDVRTDVKLDKD
jgi:hypothetical protein